MKLLVRSGQVLLSSPGRAAASVACFATMPLLQMPLGWVATVIVSLDTLAHGSGRSGPLLLAACLPSFIGAMVVDHAMLLIFLPHLAATYVAALVMHRTRSWSLVVEALAIAGLVVVSVAFALHPDLHGFWVERLSIITQPMMDQMPEQGAAFEQAVSLVAQWATGLQVASVSLVSLLGVGLARRWLLVIKHRAARRYRKVSFDRVRISVVMLIIAVVVVLGAWWWRAPFMLAAVAIVAWPFLAAGVSLFFYSLPREPMKRVIAMVLFFGALLSWMPYGFLAVMLVGLLDSPCHFRNQIDCLRSKAAS